ncbi:hypothetical protein [Dactylosporangium sp. NPDC050588]|uniref:hypothetical protein n=1 Tax=Dactylosporangium sp. NPDC050588 TaxID=3157211 RepID=UPI00340F72DD
MPSLLGIPWIAVVIVIPSVVKLLMLIIVLRGTKPSERPAILRAFANILRPRIEPRRTDKTGSENIRSE